eukprot:6153881-Pyramimonas_sp.AAC.1
MNGVYYARCYHLFCGMRDQPAVPFLYTRSSPSELVNTQARSPMLAVTPSLALDRHSHSLPVSGVLRPQVSAAVIGSRPENIPPRPT